MAETINKESILELHQTSLDLLAEDLKDSSLKWIDTDEFRQRFGQKIHKSLAEAGKDIFDTGLNKDVLTETEKQASEDFKEIYAHKLAEAYLSLTQNINSAEIIEKAQVELVKELKNNNKKLLEQLTTGLSAKEQNIIVKDDTLLNTIVEQYKEQVNDKLKDTLGFLNIFGKEFKERLSEEGKATFGVGLNIDALTTLQKQLKKAFNKDYQEVVDLDLNELLRSNEPEITIKNAQARLAEKLQITKANLLTKLATRLASKGQSFNAEDQAQIDNAFKRYMDKTAEKLNESLKQFGLLNSIKLKLQVHNSNHSTSKNATLRATGLNNARSLSDIPKPPAPTPGFTINNDKLYQQLKYTIANKKSGERINIELTIPNREENQRQMAEAGLQYRNPGLALAVSLLLFLLVHLRIFLKNDEQRIADVLNELVKKNGLSIDPKDINLKISQIGQNGKDYVIHEGTLSELSLQQLNQSSQEIKKILQDDINNNQKNKIPSSRPDSGYNTPEENSDEESERSVSPSHSF